MTKSAATSAKPLPQQRRNDSGRAVEQLDRQSICRRVRVTRRDPWTGQRPDAPHCRDGEDDKGGVEKRYPSAGEEQPERAEHVEPEEEERENCNQPTC